jgi:hypothetical protein
MRSVLSRREPTPKIYPNCLRCPQLNRIAFLLDVTCKAISLQHLQQDVDVVTAHDHKQKPKEPERLRRR